MRLNGAAQACKQTVEPSLNCLATAPAASKRAGAFVYAAACSEAAWRRSSRGRILPCAQARAVLHVYNDTRPKISYRGPRSAAPSRAASVDSVPGVTGKPAAVSAAAVALRVSFVVGSVGISEAGAGELAACGRADALRPSDEFGMVGSPMVW